MKSVTIRFNSHRVWYTVAWYLVALNLTLIFQMVLPSWQDSSSMRRAEEFPELKVLADNALDFKDLGKFFVEIAQAKGGHYAYRALAAAGNHNLFAANIDAHLIGHLVGDELYKQEGKEGMKYCTDDLRNACSHSIVVGTLLEEGPNALPSIVEICRKAPGGPGAFTMCIHGLGHGVLAFTEYDMKTAVKLCEKVGDVNANDRRFIECVGGVTMEMMAGVHDRQIWESQKDNYLSDDDPLAPCNKSFIPNSAKGMCYTYLTPHLFQVAGADLGRPQPEHFDQAFTYCDQIPNSRTQDRTTCYGSFGKEFVVLANSRNVQSVEAMSVAQLRLIYDWCLLGDRDEVVEPCVGTALSSLFWGGENNRSAAVRFCGLIDNERHQSGCINSLIGAVQYYVSDPTYYREFCSEIPERFWDTCSNRLKLAVN